MSQVTHPRIPLPAHPGPTRAAWIGALVALAAVVAVALVIALDGGSSPDTAPVAVQAQPSLRGDGGPEETSIAASIGTSSPQLSSSAPDESRVAASISAR